MTKLALHLLGGCRAELDREVIYAFKTDKARALLAYLAVEADRPHRRETLASLLWPDRPDSNARANLRQALSYVRRALRDDEPPLFLFVTSTDVQFNAASDYTLDVAELEAFARSPAGPSQLLPEAFCTDFLAGLTVRDCETFQEWVLSKQEYYHRLALEILDEQNAYFEGCEDYEKAAAAARLQLRLEPWLEEAHRRCMRALALAGHRDEALRQYESCCRALESELGIEPADSTQVLYADIRTGKFLTSRPVSGVQATQPGSLPARPPALPLRLVARGDELGRLGRHLDAALAGETGVTFVSGDAGSGKTALLEAFAASAMAQQPELLVAGARCSPGDHLNPFAPLRKLAEMLFTDPRNEVAWQLAGGDQADRLQRASDLALAALREHGPGLVGTLVPAPSIARRAGLPAERVMESTPATHSAVAHPPVPDCPAGLGEPGKRSTLAVPLSQDALFGQLLRTVAAIAREQPLLLLFDDLHWVDDASAAFLLRLGRELNGSRLLVLGAYRSATVALGRRNPRSGEVSRHPLATVINELRRARGEIVTDLDHADGRAFVEAYVDTEPNRLGAHFRNALCAQTGGHALFTVETLRNLRERGVLYKDEAGRWVAHESLDWGALPARVEAAIAERIERLPEAERRILSCASVEGDDFSAEMAAELAGMAAVDALTCLSGSLARQHYLVRAQGLQQLGSGRQSVYRFTHHLFQKYLYDGLDPVERAQLHAAVAAALDRRTAGVAEERERLGARLAWHYEAGGLPLAGARALLDAGRQAMRVSAFREALDRFDHGLALLAGEPPSPERGEVERLLEVARLGPQRNLEGPAGAGLQGTLARAGEAWADAQGRPELMMLRAEAERQLATEQFEDGLAAAEQLRAEAMDAGEQDLVALAHLYFGIIHHHAGNLQQSERHLALVLDCVTGELGARLRAATGIDLVANALGYSALNRWFLGYPEAALKLSRQAMAGALAERATVGQAVALVLGANLLFLLRVDERVMAEQSEQCYRLCLEHGIGMWRVFAQVLLGRLMVMSGENVAGIERMQDAIGDWQAMGMAIGTGCYIALLADGCLAAAHNRLARHEAERGGLLPLRFAPGTVVATGLTAIDTVLRLRSAPATIVGPEKVSCGQVYEAELRRLRGELLLARDGLAAAEEALECFRQAMQLGRQEGALAWELRGAMSLVRLRERQDAEGEPCATELAEARGCLRDVYARFTEGFAFPDLQDAAALLGNRPPHVSETKVRPG